MARLFNKLFDHRTSVSNMTQDEKYSILSRGPAGVQISYVEQMFSAFVAILGGWQPDGKPTAEFLTREMFTTRLGLGEVKNAKFLENFFDAINKHGKEKDICFEDFYLFFSRIRFGSEDDKIALLYDVYRGGSGDITRSGMTEVCDSMLQCAVVLAARFVAVAPARSRTFDDLTMDVELRLTHNPSTPPPLSHTLSAPAPAAEMDSLVADQLKKVPHQDNVKHTVEAIFNEADKKGNNKLSSKEFTAWAKTDLSVLRMLGFYYELMLVDNPMQMWKTM